MTAGRTPFADLLVGKTLVGRYELEEPIGRGGMAIVFRATDRRLGRPIAIKVISLIEGDDERRDEMRARLRREAEAAARIPPHPNVVQVYDFGTDPELDLDFIAMELVRGRDLKSVLRETRLDQEHAVEVLEQAAAGVAAGHRAGIVHRDVKPGNVVIVGAGSVEGVKILDFGIAKALEPGAEDELTRTGSSPHSPAYASPEQLSPGTPVTAASDVYQLGLLGYELLTGEPPFDQAERARIREGGRVDLTRKPSWERLPGSTRPALARALEPDPGDRYPDAEAFLHDLRHPPADLEGETTVILPAQPTEPEAWTAPERPRATKHSAVGTKHYLVGALALLIVVWLLLRDPGSESPEVAAAGMEELRTEELTETFRELQSQAHENLMEASSAESGQEAAEAVQRAIIDLTSAWVEGDADAHASHYADRVDFYGERLSRSQVRQLRAESLARYPERKIELDQIAIHFPEEGVAEALFDKSWSFGGDDDEWRGAVRSRMELELQDGRWLVTEEEDLEIYESERD